MEIDEDKVDDAVLALLRLTLHDGQRAWKGFDWDTLDRLHRKGLSPNPFAAVFSPVSDSSSLTLASPPNGFDGLWARERIEERRPVMPSVVSRGWWKLWGTAPRAWCGGSGGEVKVGG